MLQRGTPLHRGVRNNAFGLVDLVVKGIHDLIKRMLFFGHAIYLSICFNRFALRQKRRGLVQGSCNVMLVLARGLGGQAAIKPRVLRHLTQGTVKLWPDALTLGALLTG